MAGKLLILVAEESGRTAIMDAVAPLGIDVKLAVNGREVLDYVRADKFDCIILDYILPDYDSIRLIPLIRGITDTPIVVVTANGNELVAVEVMKAGALDYISKANLCSKILYKAITNAMESHRRQKDLEKRINNEINSLRQISLEANSKCTNSSCETVSTRM